MNKTLVVRYNGNEASFSVSSTEEKISALIKWAEEYHHGTFDGLNTINCNSPVDLWACKQKARHESLLSCISKDEVKAKFASM